MGIYFDYDFEDGKEVEKWSDCYLCNQKKVLFVEYHVKTGLVYSLYDNARKLQSGYQVKVGSAEYLVCEDCYSTYGSEEGLVAEIIRRRKEEKVSETTTQVQTIEKEIEETKKEFLELVERLAKLYYHLEKAKEGKVG